MKSKLISEQKEKTYALIFETDDEITTEMLNFVREKNISAARFTAIGACSRVTTAFYNLEKREYEKNPINEQVEVTSLIGNIALYENAPKLHAHIVVGKRDGTAHGGHFIEGVVRPTLEMFLIESTQKLTRTMNEAVGLPLIDLK